MPPETTAKAVRRDRVLSAHMRAHVAAQDVETAVAGLVATFDRGLVPSPRQVSAVEDAMAELTRNLATIRELEKQP